MIPGIRQLREHRAHDATGSFAIPGDDGSPLVDWDPDQPVHRHHRQPEGLEPVARVRARGLPGQRAQLTAGRFGADHPAQVALKDLDPAPWRRQARPAANLKTCAVPGRAVPANGRGLGTDPRIPGEAGQLAWPL